MDVSRKAAVQGIVRLHGGGWANLTVKDIFSTSALSLRDKAFAAALFYGTAERLVTLDYILQPFLKKPIYKLDVEVRAILETGLYQMQYMRVPARAAVNESVKLTRALGKSSASGLVNAILRKATTVSIETVSFKNELERVCVCYSLGQPVAKAVMDALPDEYDSFLQASFSRPELCLRVNNTKTSIDELVQVLEEKGAKTHKGKVPEALYADIPGGVANEPLFEKGLYHVQGEASQFACSCLNVQKGDSVLDLCAAPGGKSATLLQYSRVAEQFCACELRENRIPLIHETFARLGFAGVRVLQNDGAVFNGELGEFNRVLCDVPCSGLGVLASKPDMRYNDSVGFEALPLLQLKILATGSRYVKKGGRIVYSTCTIRPEENEQVVRAFLQQNKDFSLVEIDRLPIQPSKGCKVDNKMVTFFPHTTGLDGFFVATFDKI